MPRRVSMQRARRASSARESSLPDSAPPGAEAMSPFAAFALAHQGHLFPPQEPGPDGGVYVPNVIAPTLDAAIVRFWACVNSHVGACDGAREGVAEQ